MKSKIKRGEATFNHDSCPTTKTARKKRQAEIKKKGNRAIVVDGCVYKGPKAKKAKRKTKKK